MKKEELLDLISQTEAARLRGVSPEAIADLIRRGRLSSIDVGGKRFLRRSEVENFKKQKGGRPPKQVATQKKGARKSE
ncbi:MAG TPA: helix-turn-helix domain-containing protein [Pyrinomonadaceae bacterium]